MPSRYAPTYSHGGSSQPGHPAVSGTTTGTGRAISVIGAIQDCAMYVKLVGGTGTATVKIECNGGALDESSNPPSDGWIDMSDGGYSLSSGNIEEYKRIPAPLAPFWRTNITAIAGGAQVESAISGIVVAGPGGPQQASAQYPPISTAATPTS